MNQKRSGVFKRSVFCSLSTTEAAAKEEELHKNVWRGGCCATCEEESRFLRKPGRKRAWAFEFRGCKQCDRKWCGEGGDRGRKHQHLVRSGSHCKPQLKMNVLVGHVWDSVSHDSVQERLWTLRSESASGSRKPLLRLSGGDGRDRSPCPLMMLRWRLASERWESQSRCLERDQLTVARGDLKKPTLHWSVDRENNMQINR